MFLNYQVNTYNTKRAKLVSCEKHQVFLYSGCTNSTVYSILYMICRFLNYNRESVKFHDFQELSVQFG